MLKVRLQRVGRKHEPIFRLVVTDSQNGPKSGKFVEILGNYDSRRGDEAQFNNDRIKYWMDKGAKISGTVHNLLVSKNVISGKKINVLPKKKPLKKEEEKTESKPESVEVKEEAKSEGEELKPEAKAEESKETAEQNSSTNESEPAKPEEKKEEPKQEQNPQESKPEDPTPQLEPAPENKY